MTTNESVHARLISVNSNSCFAGHTEGLDVIICFHFFVCAFAQTIFSRRSCSTLTTVLVVLTKYL